MKKLLFAVQVFGLMAMFPIYIFLELGPQKTGSSGNNTNSIVKEKTGNMGTQVFADPGGENINAMFILNAKMGL